MSEDLPTRIGHRISGGYGDALERVFGRYYDPVLKFQLPFVVIPIIGGIADREPVFTAIGVCFGLLLAWVHYRTEQRWSA